MSRDDQRDPFHLKLAVPSADPSPPFSSSQNGRIRVHPRFNLELADAVSPHSMAPNSLHISLSSRGPTTTHSLASANHSASKRRPLPRSNILLHTDHRVTSVSQETSVGIRNSSDSDVRPLTIDLDEIEVEEDSLDAHLLDVYWELCYHLDGLLRLDRSTFVMQDWDRDLETLKVRVRCSKIAVFIIYLRFLHQSTKYHHLRLLPTSDTESSFICDCPRSPSCIHIQLAVRHLPDISSMGSLSPTPHPRAFLLAETGGIERYVFTVSATSQSVPGGGKRTLVLLLRDGSWRCRSCPGGSPCSHKEFELSFKFFPLRL